MDNFPTRKDFNDILQNPHVAFRDAELKSVKIERDAMNLPRARAGAFADVYRAILPNNQSRAIRVFASAQPERQERYQAIYDHLSRQSLGCLVPFVYSEKGIRAPNGKWYPLITMDWIAGDTLFDWLAQRAESNDGRAIGGIGDKWRTTIAAMSRATIAHGDLQHANVLITASNDIKLVDYDGMCVPPLVGRRNLEIGVEPYQHPGRDGNTLLSLGLDNFSALFIYVGLKAVAAEPRLWNEFVTRPLYDKILFRKEDLEAPAKSSLLSRLRRSRDAEVQRLSATLCELSRVRIDQVPCLEELLATFDFKMVRSCLDRRDFDAAVGLLTRNGKQVGDAPPDLQPRIRDAQQRIGKLAELVAAIDAGNEKSMATIVSSPLLQHYPGAAEAIATAKDAPGVMPVIQRLEAARAGRRWRDMVREWDAAQSVLTRPRGSLRKSALVYQADVAAWRAKNALSDQVLAAVRGPNRDLAALHAAWTKLKDLGGHPECDPHRRTVEGLLATYRPPQPNKTAAPITAARPQAQLAPSKPPQPRSLPQTAQQPSSQPASPPGLQTMAATSVQLVSPPIAPPVSPLPNPVARPLQPAGSTISGSRPAATVAPSPLHTAWTMFLIQAVTSAAGLLLRWVPPARWLSTLIPANAISPDVIVKAVMLAAAGTVGALGGGLLGGTLVSLRSSLGDTFAKWCDGEQLRITAIALGVALTLILGQNHSIRRPWMASWRQLLIAMAIAGCTAISAVTIERIIPTYSIEFIYTWRDCGLRICRSMLTWGLLGCVLGLAATRILPNIRTIPMVVGGMAAAMIATVGDVAVHSSVNATAGQLVGAACLGMCFGAIAPLVEAATRHLCLEVDRGDGLHPAKLGLGTRPVTVGSDASSCDVVVRDAPRPMAYKYWIDSQQLYLLDYVTSQPARILPGDRRLIGTVALVVTANAKQQASTGSRPPSSVATLQQHRVSPTAAMSRTAPAPTPSSRPAPPGPPPPPKAP